MNRKHSSKFKIPQRLFGRGEPTDALLKAFARASRGRGEILLVPGNSGVGKTSLVQSISESVEARNGFFVQGKFDQYQQQRPYYAFKIALTSLWAKIRTTRNSHPEQLHVQVREAVGNLGFLLVELVPELSCVFKKPSKTDDISAEEARHRFTYVISRFMSVICEAEHPVAFFLDDWQWADPASLELIKRLQIGDFLRYVLMIVSYRDEEIGKSHPLSAVIADLQRKPQQHDIIRVRNLNQSDIESLIAEILSPSVQDLNGLTEMIHGQTHGNPFYVKAFLEYLYEIKFLWFNPSLESWVWHLEPSQLPANIIDLFAKRLEKLSNASQDLISKAACLGTRFNLSTISTIIEKSPDACAALIEPIRHIGFILSEQGIYHHDTDETSPSSQWFRFMHDRVQQAAFFLIHPAHLADIRLKIGRLLLAGVNRKELDERLFEIVDHLNAGGDLMDDVAEEQKMVELNMVAAGKAKAASAFHAMLIFNKAAFHFAEKRAGGIETLWASDYKKSLILHRNLAESEFLEGDQAQAERLIHQSLRQTKTVIDRAETLSILIVHFTMHARYKEAIFSGRKALSELGIDLPEGDFESFRDTEIDLFYKNMENHSVSTLCDAPMMSDLKMRTAAKLLIAMGPPCYRTDQRLWSVIVPKVVNLTLRHGLIPQIGYSHTALGGLLGWVGNDYNMTRKLGEAAERIMDLHFQSPSERSVFYLMVGSSVRHWFKHLRHASGDYSKAYEIGLNSGNLQYAAYAFGHNMYCSFYQGVPLSGLIRDTRQSLIFSKSRLNHWAIDLLEGGLVVFNGLVDPGGIDDTAYLQQVENNHNIQVFCIYQIMITFYDMILGRYDRALSLSNETEALIHTVGTQGLLPWPEHVFCRSMILTSLFTGVNNGTRKQWHSELRHTQKQMGVWSELCAENYLHKYLLLSAELKRIDNFPGEAIGHYERAIEAAHANRFLQWEALANERASQFCLEQGNESLAQVYWQQAYNCYHLWGAGAKLELMENEFRDRLHSWHIDINIKSVAKGTSNEKSRKAFVKTHVNQLRSKAIEKQEVRKHAIISKEADELAGITERLRKEISKRKKAEKSLRESENRFRILFDNAPLPYQSLDEKGHFMEANLKWLNLLGYEREEVIGKSFADFLHPEWINHFKENFPKFKSIGEILGVEFELRKKDGTFIWVTFDGRIRRDNEGAFIQTLCVFSDITERRILEKKLKEQEIALRHAQKMQSIGTLAGGIAHDFNNILSIIIGSNELVADEIPEWSPVRKNVEDIRIAGLRARDVVRQLLTFSRQDDAKKTPLDIVSVIKESVKLIRSTIPTNIVITMAISEVIDPIWGNATQINQLLINLCANAKDALSKSGGRIKIELSNETIDDKPPIVHPILSPGEYVKLTIADDGCGMDKVTLDRIFDPYFTTKEIGKGTGIGLAVTHGIVDRHDGAISAESEPGKGTTFTILFPVCENVVEADTEEDSSLPTGHERILLVDDEASIMKLVKQQLEMLGYEVIGITDSVEALDIYRKDPGDFDLVVTDMAMPKCTGEQLSREILKIRPQMPIILCTGYSENISKETAHKIGISAFINKPIGRNDLAVSVREVLDEDKRPTNTD